MKLCAVASYRRETKRFKDLFTFQRMVIWAGVDVQNEPFNRVGGAA